MKYKNYKEVKNNKNVEKRRKNPKVNLYNKLISIKKKVRRKIN